MLSKLALGVVIAILFIALIVLFCFVLIKLYVDKIKNYTTQLYQKDLNFQKTLNTTIIETQEQLLQNISQDLHDDAGQQLTYINFQLENLKLDSPELKATLDPVSLSVDALSKSVRAISHSLNHQMITGQELDKAIISELKRLKKMGRIAFHCQVFNAEKRVFNTNEKIVIYRIFQEIVNNAIKHSKAKNIVTTLNTTPVFMLSIADDGKGFVYDESKTKTGMGLYNLKHRAQIINYDLEIKSIVNQGTTITLTEIKV